MKSRIGISTLVRERRFLHFAPILMACIWSPHAYPQGRSKPIVERVEPQRRESSDGKPRAIYPGESITPATQLTPAQILGKDATPSTPLFKFKPKPTPITVESLLGRDSLEESQPTEARPVNPQGGPPRLEEATPKTLDGRLETVETGTHDSSDKANERRREIVNPSIFQYTETAAAILLIFGMVFFVYRSARRPQKTL